MHHPDVHVVHQGAFLSTSGSKGTPAYSSLNVWEHPRVFMPNTRHDWPSQSAGEEMTASTRLNNNQRPRAVNARVHCVLGLAQPQGQVTPHLCTI